MGRVSARTNVVGVLREFYSGESRGVSVSRCGGGCGCDHVLVVGVDVSIHGGVCVDVSRCRWGGGCCGGGGGKVEWGNKRSPTKTLEESNQQLQGETTPTRTHLD